MALLLAECYSEAGSVVVFEPSVPANAELLGRAAAVAHVIKHSNDRSVGGLDELHVRPRQGQLRIVTYGAEGLELRVGTADDAFRRWRRWPLIPAAPATGRQQDSWPDASRGAKSYERISTTRFALARR